jgi:tetratricopeptide (TPR) repeat protein
MQTAARSNLVLTEFFSLKGLSGVSPRDQGALYQQFFSEIFKLSTRNETVSRLAQHLAETSHHAYDLRQLDTVWEASQMLLALPVSEQWKQVGNYYQAKYLWHKGQINEAYTMLERVAEKAPIRYRARAVQLLAMTRHAQSDFDSALPLYQEACHIAASNEWCDPLTTITASQNIAVLKSMNGDHRAALADLEKLFPIVRAVPEPYKFYHYLNSLAVELGEVGRIEEAQNMSKIVLASPYAFAYPEWRETGQDLALRGYKSRSIVLLTQRIHRNLLYFPERNLRNLLYFPERNLATGAPIKSGRAGVLSIEKWKKKMGKENGEQNLDEMSDKDLFMEIMHQTSQGPITRKKLLKFLDAILKIKREPDED